MGLQTWRKAVVPTKAVATQHVESNIKAQCFPQLSAGDACLLILLFDPLCVFKHILLIRTGKPKSITPTNTYQHSEHAISGTPGHVGMHLGIPSIPILLEIGANRTEQRSVFRRSGCSPYVQWHAHP